MSERNEQRHHCAVQLAGLIVHAAQAKPPSLDIADALIIIDNIVDYSIAVAQDRIIQAGADMASQKLAEAVLRKHAETAPAPEEG